MGKNKGGRPTKYKQEFEDQAFKMSLLGLTDEQLAGYFEVDLSTLNKWKKDYPKFSESIKAGKEEADAKVLKAMYQNAIGYSHPDVVISVVSDGAGLGSSIVKTDVTKHYPPNERAGRFWLMNRQRDKWTEKQEIGFTDKQGNDINPLLAVPTDQLKQIEEILSKAHRNEPEQDNGQ